MRVAIAALCAALGLWAGPATAQEPVSAPDPASRQEQTAATRGADDAREPGRLGDEPGSDEPGGDERRPDDIRAGERRKVERRTAERRGAPRRTAAARDARRVSDDPDARLLPAMTRGSREQVRWFDRADAVTRYAAPASATGRSGGPHRITWLDRSGRVVQVWQDDDRDGRADRVTIYENGRVVRVLRR